MGVGRKGLKMQVKAIKVHDWQVVEADHLEEGEQNAAIISFRISNIQGLKENFSGYDLVVILAKAAGAIYSDLQEAKISDKLN